MKIGIGDQHRKVRKLILGKELFESILPDACMHGIKDDEKERNPSINLDGGLLKRETLCMGIFL